ncbi:hypothetical protein BDZ97DRAFT_1922421 [Flammula alnicola]|nr:hypothetical protein BDZ97DRAFT_1922421 [Flammula alnicola]
MVRDEVDAGILIYIPDLGLVRDEPSVRTCGQADSVEGRTLEIRNFGGPGAYNKSASPPYVRTPPHCPPHITLVQYHTITDQVLGAT